MKKCFPFTRGVTVFTGVMRETEKLTEICRLHEAFVSAAGFHFVSLQVKRRHTQGALKTGSDTDSEKWESAWNLLKTRMHPFPCVALIFITLHDGSRQDVLCCARLNTEKIYRKFLLAHKFITLTGYLIIRKYKRGLLQRLCGGAEVWQNSL